jgi:hypothetical protein
MEQLTLEQEINRIPEVPDHYIEGEPDAYIEGWKVGMKEGAEWQKEQYNPLTDAAEMALDYLSVKYPREAEILHKLKNALERL